MDTKNNPMPLSEVDLTRRAQRLRAETLAGWVRGLRRRVTGQPKL